MILGDPPVEPFFRERFQQAFREHLCHDCGEPIPSGMKYRVVVWKKKWFHWKKNHEVCACQTSSSSSESGEERASQDLQSSVIVAEELLNFL